MPAIELILGDALVWHGNPKQTYSRRRRKTTYRSSELKPTIDSALKPTRPARHNANSGIVHVGVALSCVNNFWSVSIDRSNGGFPARASTPSSSPQMPPAMNNDSIPADSAPTISCAKLSPTYLREERRQRGRRRRSGRVVRRGLASRQQLKANG